MQINSMPNLAIFPALPIWPRTLRCITEYRISRSTELLVGSMPSCSRNVNRWPDAEAILLASPRGYDAAISSSRSFSTPHCGAVAVFINFVSWKNCLNLECSVSASRQSVCEAPALFLTDLTCLSESRIRCTQQRWRTSSTLYDASPSVVTGLW